MWIVSRVFVVHVCGLCMGGQREWRVEPGEQPIEGRADKKSSLRAGHENRSRRAELREPAAERAEP